MSQNPNFNDSMNHSFIGLPPHSLEAEQSFLGALLSNNEIWLDLENIIQPNDFYRVEHQLIYAATSELLNQGKTADLITVSDLLEKKDNLETIGGRNYIIDILNNTPSASHIRDYADIIRVKSVMRQLAKVGTDIVSLAHNPQGLSSSEILDEAENLVFQIAEQNQKAQKGFIKVDRVLTSVEQKISELYHSDNTSGITGLATGFVDLDKITSGLQPSDLIIIAGRPSMGKTAFAMNIAEFAGVEMNKGVGVFSMEMGADQLVMRMIGSLGRVDQGKLRTGKLSHEQWKGFAGALEKLSGANIFIDETPALNALEVRARARRLARTKGVDLGLIVLDYIQLMSGSKRSENRSTEIAEISRSLKTLAKELQVPIIALSQLSRSVESRSDKRPMMSDLRESGAIEQDADLIVFMYRDIYYNPDSQYKNTAEAIISKHRNGATGKVYLNFFGEYAKFENADMTHHYE